MKDKLLFKWCECSEYLMKVSDGCCIGKAEKNELIEAFGTLAPFEQQLILHEVQPRRSM